ncbi:hypothetical protein MTP10_37130 [Nonomuraea sp. 3-1Str]|uniref:hypothetical protein n=1 Tax=unclassified Nonomuraea TaxID=2593643 RepID=UPI0028614C4E|nr:hypothetical protein [Nonomuraea sp. 3-1Str]MDR8414342.1 hypothetical protein [Nonomuraea sp. 3-1Str]
MVVSLLACGSSGAAGGGSSGLSILDDPILTYGLPVSLSRRSGTKVINRIFLHAVLREAEKWRNKE